MICDMTNAAIKIESATGKAIWVNYHDFLGRGTFHYIKNEIWTNRDHSFWMNAHSHVYDFLSES